MSTYLTSSQSVVMRVLRVLLRLDVGREEHLYGELLRVTELHCGELLRARCRGRSSRSESWVVQPVAGVHELLLVASLQGIAAFYRCCHSEAVPVVRGDWSYLSYTCCHSPPWRWNSCKRRRSPQVDGGGAFESPTRNVRDNGRRGSQCRGFINRRAAPHSGRPKCRTL